MTTELVPYPKLKDSTEPWLGPIPDHWTMRRVKTLLHQRVEKNHPDEPLLAATQTKGVVRKDQYENRTVLAMKDLHLLKLVRKGDFVISLRSFQGGIEYAREQGIISPAYTVLYPETPEIHGYLAHLFKSRPFIKNLSLYVTGIRQGQNIDYDRLSRSYLPVPPPHEQLLITRYLTHINNQVNRFIRAKRRLIELLEEEKRVVVHQAVTRGLDPDVKMKESGVEWLGEVPEGWEVRRLGAIGTFFKGSGGTKADEVETGVPCVRYGDLYGVHDYHIHSARSKISPDSASGYTAIQPGDILFACSGETTEEIGKSAVNLMSGAAYCGGDIAILRPHIPIDYEFLGFMADSPPIAIQKSLRSRGTIIKHVYPSELKDVLCPLPSLESQTRIATHIKSAISLIEKTEARATHHITLLNEYRTRLISDVVTGKLDVREAAAGLPDVEEEVEAGEEGDLEGVDELLEEEMG